MLKAELHHVLRYDAVEQHARGRHARIGVHDERQQLLRRRARGLRAEAAVVLQQRGDDVDFVVQVKGHEDAPLSPHDANISIIFLRCNKL